MPLFLKVTIPLMILLLFHFFYLNGKKLIKSQDLYRLEKVSFIGVEASDPYEVIESLGLEKGINLLFLNTDELNRKIKTIPRYKHAEVILQYPDTLILKLEEKKPEFIVKVNAKMYTVNSAGEMTERSHEIKKFDLFFIETIDFESIDQILQHYKYQKFIRYAQSLPEEERNIFQIFSGIKFSRFNKDWILYGNRKEMRFNLGKELSLEKLRKSRYAYIYGNHKKISIDNVFITKNLVYFNQ